MALYCLIALSSALVYQYASAQAACYVGPGLQYRAPSWVVPCVDDGASACCALGDVCLSGNACYNFYTRNTYQYGCTDVKYEDASCPAKCGFNASRSRLTY